MDYVDIGLILMYFTAITLWINAERRAGKWKRLYYDDMTRGRFS